MSSASLTIPADLEKLFVLVLLLLLCFLFHFCFLFLDLFTVHVHRHIDANKSRYISALGEAVAIKSVSAWPDHRSDITKMAKWTAAKLKKLGAHVELAELGNQTLHCGRVIPLPEVVLGTLGNVGILQ